MKNKTTKLIKRCTFEGCKNLKHQRDKFCSFHANKATISRSLSHLYSDMKRRVEGKGTHNRGDWAGKPILSKDVFITWSRNHPIFLSLYKQWTMSDFNRKLTPSINRMKSSKGYTLDNMEWMTSSQNSGLAGAVRKVRQRTEIYNLLGVNK